MIKCSLDMLVSWGNEISVEANTGFISARRRS
jgi:hypothetical protein